MANTHTTLIDRYLAGAAKLRASVRGLTDEQLDALPVPGTWSIRTIVVHLLHAEVFLVARMLQIAAEETPLIMNWEESAFVDRLHYERSPIEPALVAIEGLRASTAVTLKSLDEEAFERVGIHSKAGKLRLIDVVTKSADHLEHHLSFIEKKRAMVTR